MATHIEIRGSLGVVRGLYVVVHIFITVKKQYSVVVNSSPILVKTKCWKHRSINLDS